MFDDFTRALAEVASLFWFALLAAWGGTVNYLSRLKRTPKMKFSFVELMMEWVISGFAGLITAYACAANDVSYPLTAALAGIAGHMGGRAISIFESRFFGKGADNAEKRN